ncbi:MAG: hypothetical protein FJY47_07440 [Betaproteobacteria bacterium]|nr:hypothetical protein [Betaproteobacteria bacterium]
MIIDSLAFAASGQSCDGTIPAARLPRLSERIVDGEGEVEYQLHGAVREGRPVLGLSVSGSVSVTCQRCLGPMRWGFEFANCVRLARDEAELDLADAEGVDAVEASEALDVEALVEDELLLNWPIAPRHDDAGCARAGGAEAGATRQPFAALKALVARSEAPGSAAD